MVILDISRHDIGKHEILVRDILTNIQDGQLKPGQRLPTESELTKTYNLGRNSVRRGLLKLQEEGLIIKKRGSGTYIAGMVKQDISLHRETRPSIIVYNFRLSEGNAWFGEGIRKGIIQGVAQQEIELLELPLGNRRPYLPSDNLVGIIVFAAGADNPSKLLANLPTNIPRLVLNRTSEDSEVPSIDIDHEEGAYQAGAFLLRFGHRQPVMITMNSANPTFLQRTAGFRKAFHAAGVPFDDSFIEVEPGRDDPHFSEWPLILKKLLRRQPRPSALLMMNHGRALHILEIIHSEGLRIPEDISLILFDEDDTLLMSKPTISSVRLPLRHMGNMAVDMLMEKYQGNHLKSKYIHLRPELMIRESVALPPK